MTHELQLTSAVVSLLIFRNSHHMPELYVDTQSFHARIPTNNSSVSAQTPYNDVDRWTCACWCVYVYIYEYLRH